MSATRPESRSLRVAAAGAVVSVLVAGALAMQLPTALKRDERAREVVALQRQVAAIRADITSAGSDTSSLQARLTGQERTNDQLKDRIADQKQAIARQKKKFHQLGG